MRSFVTGLEDALNAKIQQVLHQQGHECPAAHVFPLKAAAAKLAESSPELLVVNLLPDPEQALKALDELRANSQVPVVVVGPVADSRLVLRALRSGARDYVNDSEIDTELVAALQRLRTELYAQSEPGRTIAILAPSGGSGSSTLAVNIATVLAKEHKSAFLFDLKLESGDLAALLDLKPTHTLAELCQNAARMDRSMFERSLVQHSSGVRLLAHPRSLADVSYVTPDGVRQAVSLARSLYPYVILDMDHTFREEQIQALRQADLVLLVLRLDFTCLRNTQRVLDHFNRLNISVDRIKLVANRFGQAKEVPAAKAEEALNMKIFHYVPEDSKTINRANNNGIPAVLESPSAKVCRSFAQLAVSVNGRHDKS